MTVPAPDPAKNPITSIAWYQWKRYLFADPTEAIAPEDAAAAGLRVSIGACCWMFADDLNCPSASSAENCQRQTSICIDIFTETV